MAAIDWRVKGMAAFDLVPSPKDVDWNDPTHLPCMVGDIACELGCTEDSLDDSEYLRALVIALDAMPRGRLAVREEVEQFIRGCAAAGNWSEYLLDKETGRYPFEDDA
jgi:hypothetical protein